jgi:hypothetical protein
VIAGVRHHLLNTAADPANVVGIPNRDYMHYRPYDTPSHLLLGGAYKLIALPPASSHATHFRTFNITSHRVTSQRCGHVHQQYGCRTTCPPGRFPSSACAPADNPPNAARLTIRSAPSRSTCRTDRHTATTASAPVHNTPWAHTPNPTQSLSTCQPEMCRFHNENGGFRPIVRN